ncbi:hypothetical protein V7056_20660, partial [Bacillus sp. JJ664]
MPKKQKPNDIFQKGSKLAKEKAFFLGKTGEYGTVSKLARIGIDSYLTKGNKKTFDIVAVGNNRSITIQVKTSKELTFPTRFFQKYYDYSFSTPDFWVFVHSFAEKDYNYKEDFYVLTHEELK